MMSKLGCAFMLVCCVFTVSAQGELLLNGSVEEGPVASAPSDSWNENIDPYDWIRVPSDASDYTETGGWAFWKEDGFYGAGPAQEGFRYFVVGDNDTAGHWGAFYQDVSGFTVGEKVTFGAWYKAEDLGPKDPYLTIYLPGAGAPFDYLSLAAEAGYEPNDWTYYELNTTVPAGGGNLRFMVYGQSSLDGLAGGGCFFDDITVYLTDGARHPDPANQSYVLPDTDVTLTWDVPVDGNDVAVSPSAVYFGPAGSMGAVTPDTETSYNAGVLAVGDYEFQVDTAAQTGRVWSFTVGNQAPVIISPAQDSLGNLLFLINGQLEMRVSVGAEDIDAYPSELSYSWSQVSGPATIDFSDTEIVNPYISLDTAGIYEIQVAVSDGEDTTIDTALFNVESSVDAYLMMHVSFDDENHLGYDAISGKTGVIHDRDEVAHPDPTSMYVAEGIAGGCVDFDYRYFLEFDGDPNFLTDMGDEHTLMMWVKCDDDEINQPHDSYYFTRSRAWALFRRNFGLRFDGWYDGRGIMDATPSILNLWDGSWAHLTVAKTPTTLTIYVNGAPVASQGMTGTFDVTAYADQDPDIAIGGNARDNEETRTWNGYIDDVKFYSVGLNREVILSLIGEYGLSSVCLATPDGDVNGDCYVNIDDFAIIAANWLDCTDAFGTCNYDPFN